MAFSSSSKYFFWKLINGLRTTFPVSSIAGHCSNSWLKNELHVPSNAYNLPGSGTVRREGWHWQTAWGCYSHWVWKRRQPEAATGRLDWFQTWLSGHFVSLAPASNLHSSWTVMLKKKKKSPFLMHSPYQGNQAWRRMYKHIWGKTC